MILQRSEPLAKEVTHSIHVGDLDAMHTMLADHPALASARIGDHRGSGTLLHIVTDWPGFFPNGPAVVKLLITAGSDPNARTEGGTFLETPLHWAASSDDVEVAEALILGGADLEAGGASIAGGTALDNAIGYACWRVARLLLARGAKVEKLWHAAALGLTSTVETFFQGNSSPSNKDLNDAFWHACNGGHRRTAEYLAARGADLGWIPDYAKETPLQLASRGGHDTGRDALVNWLRAKGARAETK